MRFCLLIVFISFLECKSQESEKLTNQAELEGKFNSWLSLGKVTLDFEMDIDEKTFKMLRNLPYARKGALFSNTEITRYFQEFSWYNPKQPVSEIKLTEKEKKIVERIRYLEKIYTKTFSGKGSFIGTVYFADPNDHNNELHFCGNQKFVLNEKFTELDDSQCGQYLTGSYVFRDNQMIGLDTRLCQGKGYGKKEGAPVTFTIYKNCKMTCKKGQAEKEVLPHDLLSEVKKAYLFQAIDSSFDPGKEGSVIESFSREISPVCKKDFRQ